MPFAAVAPAPSMARQHDFKQSASPMPIPPKMPLYHSRSGRAFNVTEIRPHERNEKHLSETSAAFKLKAVTTRCYKQAIHLIRQKPSEQGNNMRFQGSPCLHTECWHTHSLRATRTKKNPQQSSFVCQGTCTARRFR